MAIRPIHTGKDAEKMFSPRLVTRLLFYAVGIKE